MGRLLNILSIVFLAMLSWKGTSMAQNADYRYNAVISTKGSPWSFRANDIFLHDNINIDHADRSPNIGIAMRPGRNTLSLLFSPLVGQDPETGKHLYKLHDGVEIDITVSRHNWRERSDEDVNILRIRYDEETKSWISFDKTFDGFDRVLETEHIYADGHYTVHELKGQKIVFFTGEYIGGYRLDIDFETRDYFPPFHWEADATTLEDTAQTRRELYKAYQRVYNTILKGDGEAIFREVEPIWANTAYLLTEYASARELIEDDELGLARFQHTRPNGFILQPLNLSENLVEDQVVFMGNNRLAYVLPDPISWHKQESDRTSSFPVVFYKTNSGEWRIAEIATKV